MNDETVEQYVRAVEDAICSRNGERLLQLVTMSSTEARSAGMKFLLDGGAIQVTRLGPEWEELPQMLQCRFAAGNALVAANFVESVTYLGKCLGMYLNVVSKEDCWTLPLLQDLCRDTRVLAEQADQQLRADNAKTTKMEEVERLLKRAFTATNNDRREVSEGSRRVGTLAVINQLLKVYFKLNNLRLCNNIVRAVDAPNFPPFETTFPVADRVTYKYFVGRLHLYDDRIPQAVECLEYAFDRTPDDYRTQKRLQLLYLVPAKIHFGELPSQALLERYDMKCYIKLVSALKMGDLASFNAAMTEHQTFFIGAALYLVLENVRPLVYRSLVRQIRAVANTNKLKIGSMQAALAACGVKMGRQETECVLANLIYNNYVRGYIAHKLGYLVLSKQNPFPPVVANGTATN